MKPIWPLLLALLCAVPAAGLTAPAQAAGLGLTSVGLGGGLKLSLGAVLDLGPQDDDRRHRRDDDRRDDRRDNRRDDRGGDQRDDRMNRAIAIARSRGTPINAWPQGGSLFMVRVDTSRGRVDLVIDVDSGRIVDER